MRNDKNLLCSLLFLLMGTVFAVAYFNSPIHDFGNYYFGSRFALEGKSIHDIYEPYRFNLLIREVPFMKHETFLDNYAVVPPFTLLFYIPFTFFNVALSKFLFNILSVLVFSFYLLKLLRHVGISSPWVLVLPLVAAIPFRNNILFGQTYILLTGFLMAGFMAEDKNKNAQAAAWYSLAIVLKISPAILLFYLVARKNWKAALLTFTFSTLLFFSALVFTGWDLMKHYIFEFLPRMSVNEINNPYATTYQSITVLLRNLFVPDPLLNPSAPFNSVNAFLLLGGLCTGLLFYFFIRQLLKSADRFAAFAFTMMSGLLLSAYTSSYSLVFLLPAAILALQQKNFKTVITLLLVFLICLVPVSVFQSWPLPLRFPRLYLLAVLFFVLTFPVKSFFAEGTRAVVLATCFMAVTFYFSRRTTDEGHYYTSKEISLLTCGYQFRKDQLVLTVLEEHGPKEVFIPLPDTIRSVMPITVQDYPRYFGSGFSKDSRILNPVLINEKEIVYLSDRRRGIGFYALRKIGVEEAGAH